MTKSEQIDKLLFILECYKNFVETSQGKTVAKQMEKSAEMEYAVMKTNEMLEIRDANYLY